MPVCVVKLCKNNTTRNKKNTGITYHQFPADPVIFDRWTAIVRLSREESSWKPGKRCVICSAHFNESDMYFTKCGLKRLCKGAVPQNALFLLSTPSDNISDYSTVTPQPNTSVPVVNFNNSAMVASEQSKAQLELKKKKQQYDPFKEYANVSTDEESLDEQDITDEVENSDEDQAEKGLQNMVTENVSVKTQNEDRQAKRARIETEDDQVDFTEQLYEFGKFVAEQLMCLDVEDARVAQAEIRILLAKFNTNKIMSCFVESSTIKQSVAEKPSDVLTHTHKPEILKPAVSTAKRILPKSLLLNTAGPSGTQSGTKKLRETLDSSTVFDYVVVPAPDLTQSDYGTPNESSATESSNMPLPIPFFGSIKTERERASPHRDISSQTADTESLNISSRSLIKIEPASDNVEVCQPHVMNIQSHIKFEPDSDSDT